ncbi:hypothetical protein N7478_004886 [Penicillium angulare]|uniref:uncharacterized protein n=1 Tax=Penicillium angulare TaxID=116970 RepID=UPI0025425B58|nr:uncharacterized protein N7478_004886 [Penicillium angulare]KAJ5279514.1 hypothetical protein N7478_004886 [Penicillium angulare]
MRSLNAPGCTRPNSSYTSSDNSPWNTSMNKRDSGKEHSSTIPNVQREEYVVESTHSSPDDPPAYERVEQIVTTTDPDPSWNSREEELEYAADFYRVLDVGQPDQIMASLTDLRSAQLVASLPQTVFIEALHQLSPVYFVEPFRDLHHALPSWASLIQGIKRAEEHFDNFVRNLFTIVRYRTTGPYPLELAEYTHLLDCARSMGNGPFAEELWQSMRREDVIPDMNCYNYWMEAQVWDHCYTGQEAFRLRVVPKTYKKRRAEHRNIGWRGPGTGNHSVRRRILPMYRIMMKAGHSPDEQTCINLLLASARTGHKLGMREVMQTVWNVDIDAVKDAEDPSTLPPPTPYPKSSALYPTEKLLFAVAHAFGTNNDILGAVQVIQFLSANYKIKVPAKAWYELLERAFVLSRVRPGGVKNHWENELGKVSPDVVRSIFETMTSEPHNVKTTGPVWRFMLKTAYAFGTLEECRSYLSRAYKVLLSTRRQQEMARQLVIRLLNPVIQAPVGKGENQQVNPNLLKSPLLAEAINKYDIKRLELYQQTRLLQRSAMSIAVKKEWNEISFKSWIYQLRPKVMEEWQDFMPRRFLLHYGDLAGEVTFRGNTNFADRDWNKGPYVPVKRITEGKKPGAFPDSFLFWKEADRWDHMHEKYPWLDTSMKPLSTLFTFQTELSDEIKAKIQELKETWVDYPEDHALAGSGFHGRLVHLRLDKPQERSSFLLDENSLI